MKRKTPDETKAKNVENAAELRRKPSKAQQACGPEFENKAIDANMDKLKIQATSLEYRCKKCGAVQEVDILGQSQVAEMKSRTSKGVKNAGEQCRNLMSIQQQLFGAGSQPLAKVDGSRSDTAESQAIYKRRGFALEVL
jgi:hypothetical protein